LGVVLYTLLTGRTPFEGSSFVDLLHKHRYAQFDRPQKIMPEIPYEIDKLVCDLLEKDPANRPADCLVLSREIERIRNRLARKGDLTRAPGTAVTVAEGRLELDLDRAGEATLMSQLMRSELGGQRRGHPLSELLNRAWVLIILLGLCIGVILWAFWPL